MTIHTLATIFRISNSSLGRAEAEYAASRFLAEADVGHAALAANWLNAVNANRRETPTIKVGTLEQERRMAQDDPLLAAVLAERE